MVLYPSQPMAVIGRAEGLATLLVWCLPCCVGFAAALHPLLSTASLGTIVSS